MGGTALIAAVKYICRGRREGGREGEGEGGVCVGVTVWVWV